VLRWVAGIASHRREGVSWCFVVGKVEAISLLRLPRAAFDVSHTAIAWQYWESECEGEHKREQQETSLLIAIRSYCSMLELWLASCSTVARRGSDPHFAVVSQELDICSQSNGYLLRQRMVFTYDRRLWKTE
jgi:hypothetical protein